MTALYEENLDFHDTTEVHWSTGTILAVFFAASLISAVFFGLGYSFGGAGSSKSAVADAPAASAAQPTASSSNRAVSSSSAIAVLQSTASASASQTSDSVRDSMRHVPVALRPVSATRTAHPAAVFAVRPATPASARHATAAASEASKVHTMVQVGAIGNRKDAERLVAKLRKKGFYAGIYRGKHDKFLHVQIGPYKNEQQAQSMRHHLTASGYRAILKTAS